MARQPSHPQHRRNKNDTVRTDLAPFYRTDNSIGGAQDPSREITANKLFLQKKRITAPIVVL